MAQPVCPEGWTCSFTPPAPPPDPGFQGDFWMHPIVGPGLVVIGVIAILILWYIWHDYRLQKHEEAQKTIRAREAAANNLAMAEQTSMQIDACQGNPEMLKLVKQLQK